jgi:hypothetical protein
MARLLAMLPVVMLASTAPAQLVDHPVGGKRLFVQRNGSEGKFLFVSKDPTLLFPVPGSPDDPRNPNTPSVVLVTPVEAVQVAIPGGPGSMGWKMTTSGVPTYVYKNPLAPVGGFVRKLVLKQGKVLRVLSASPGLQLAAPSDRIGVSVTIGSLRNCTVFAGGAVRKDVAGKFVAGATPSPTIADCYNDTLLGVTTTTSTTSTTSTTLGCDCGGTCAPTEYCVLIGSPGGSSFCGCIPAGSTLCGSPGVPACGGECPTDMFCSAYFPQQPSSAGPFCACAFAGTQCDVSFAWGGAPSEGFPFACYPVPCIGKFPMCTDACGDGGTCSAYTVGGGFSGCLCSVGEPCEDMSPGFVCPPGKFCHISGPTTRSCSPP